MNEFVYYLKAYNVLALCYFALGEIEAAKCVFSHFGPRRRGKRTMSRRVDWQLCRAKGILLFFDRGGKKKRW